MSLQLEELQARLARWEAFRGEMLEHQQQMAKLAGKFLALGAFESSASCAIKAEGLKFIVGRMPTET